MIPSDPTLIAQVPTWNPGQASPAVPSASLPSAGMSAARFQSGQANAFLAGFLQAGTGGVPVEGELLTLLQGQGVQNLQPTLFHEAYQQALDLAGQGIPPYQNLPAGVRARVTPAEYARLQKQLRGSDPSAVLAAVTLLCLGMPIGQICGLMGQNQAGPGGPAQRSAPTAPGGQAAASGAMPSSGSPAPQAAAPAPTGAPSSAPAAGGSARTVSELEAAVAQQQGAVDAARQEVQEAEKASLETLGQTAQDPQAFSEAQGKYLLAQEALSAARDKEATDSNSAREHEGLRDQEGRNATAAQARADQEQASADRIQAQIDSQSSQAVDEEKNPGSTARRDAQVASLRAQKADALARKDAALADKAAAEARQAQQEAARAQAAAAALQDQADAQKAQADSQTALDEMDRARTGQVDGSTSAALGSNARVQAARSALASAEATLRSLQGQLQQARTAAEQAASEQQSRENYDRLVAEQAAVKTLQTVQSSDRENCIKKAADLVEPTDMVLFVEDTQNQDGDNAGHVLIVRNGQVIDPSDPTTVYASQQDYLEQHPWYANADSTGFEELGRCTGEQLSAVMAAGTPWEREQVIQSAGLQSIESVRFADPPPGYRLDLGRVAGTEQADGTFSLDLAALQTSDPATYERLQAARELQQLAGGDSTRLGFSLEGDTIRVDAAGFLLELGPDGSYHRFDDSEPSAFACFQTTNMADPAQVQAAFQAGLAVGGYPPTQALELPPGTTLTPEQVAAYQAMGYRVGIFDASSGRMAVRGPGEQPADTLENIATAADGAAPVVYTLVGGPRIAGIGQLPPQRLVELQSAVETQVREGFAPRSFLPATYGLSADSSPAEWAATTSLIVSNFGSASYSADWIQPFISYATQEIGANAQSRAAVATVLAGFSTGQTRVDWPGDSDSEKAMAGYASMSLRFLDSPEAVDQFLQNLGVAGIDAYVQSLQLNPPSSVETSGPFGYPLGFSYQDEVGSSAREMTRMLAQMADLPASPTTERFFASLMSLDTTWAQGYNGSDLTGAIHQAVSAHIQSLSPEMATSVCQWLFDQARGATPALAGEQLLTYAGLVAGRSPGGTDTFLQMLGPDGLMGFFGLAQDGETATRALAAWRTEAVVGMLEQVPELALSPQSMQLTTMAFLGLPESAYDDPRTASAVARSVMYMRYQSNPSAYGGDYQNATAAADRLTGFLADSEWRKMFVSPVVSMTTRQAFLTLFEQHPDWSVDQLASTGRGWENTTVLRAYGDIGFSFYAPEAGQTTSLNAGSPELLEYLQSAAYPGVDFSSLSDEKLEQLMAPIQKVYDQLGAQFGTGPVQIETVPIVFVSDQTGPMPLPLFRIRSGDQEIYLDTNSRGSEARVYNSLSEWTSGNQLPPGQVLVPQRGADGTMTTQVLSTPDRDASFWRTADLGSLVVGLVGLGMVATGVGVVPGALLLGGSGLYQGARGASALVDMATHRQNIFSTDALPYWFDAIGGLAGGGSLVARSMGTVLRGSVWGQRLMQAATALGTVGELSGWGFLGYSGVHLVHNWDQMDDAQRAFSLAQLAFMGGLAWATRGIGRGENAYAGADWTENRALMADFMHGEQTFTGLDGNLVDFANLSTEGYWTVYRNPASGEMRVFQVAVGDASSVDLSTVVSQVRSNLPAGWDVVGGFHFQPGGVTVPSMADMAAEQVMRGEFGEGFVNMTAAWRDGLTTTAFRSPGQGIPLSEVGADAAFELPRPLVPEGVAVDRVDLGQGWSLDHFEQKKLMGLPMEGPFGPETDWAVYHRGDQIVIVTHGMPDGRIPSLDEAMEYVEQVAAQRGWNLDNMELGIACCYPEQAASALAAQGIDPGYVLGNWSTESQATNPYSSPSWSQGRNGPTMGPIQVWPRDANYLDPTGDHWRAIVDQLISGQIPLTADLRAQLIDTFGEQYMRGRGIPGW